MQIGRVNNTGSFTGLWSMSQPQLVKDEDVQTPIYKCDAFYHPFSDEKLTTVEREMTKAAENNVMAAYDVREDNHNSAPEKYIVINPVLGRELDITSHAYEGIQKMTPEICFEPEGCTECRPVSLDKDPEIKKVIDEIV